MSNGNTSRFVGGFNIGATSTPMMRAPTVVIPEHLKIKNKFEEEVLNYLFGQRMGSNGEIEAEGMTPSSVITLFGVKGVGKSTLVLGVLHRYGLTGKKTGMCSNEESAEQLSAACKRTGATELDICHKNNLEDILLLIEEYDLIGIDSLQGIVVPGVKSKSDEVAMNAISEHAKKFHCSVIVITHATKAGTAKGGSGIEHIADQCVGVFPGSEKVALDYYIEKPIIIRTDKNRFGRDGDLILSLTPLGYDFDNSPNLFYGSLMPFDPTHIAKR